MTSLASDSLPSCFSQYFNICVSSPSSLCHFFLLLLIIMPISQSSPLLRTFPVLTLICLHVHQLCTLSLPGPLTVSVEDPPPAAAPPVVSPSFPSSSSSVFSPPSSDLWTPERSRPRASAPNRNARIPPRTDLPLDTLSPFVWRRGALTECSASCGKG